MSSENDDIYVQERLSIFYWLNLKDLAAKDRSLLKTLSSTTLSWEHLADWVKYKYCTKVTVGNKQSKSTSFSTATLGIRLFNRDDHVGQYIYRNPESSNFASCCDN